MLASKEPEILDSPTYKRDHTERARFDLIPMDILERLALIYGEGAAKYGDDNWKIGCPWSDTLNHALKHLKQWRDGDRSEDQLAKVIWGFVTLAYYDQHGIGEDNLHE